MTLNDPIDTAVMTCALRFDGWKYVEDRGDSELLSTLSTRAGESLEMFSDANENHAAFFALQRYLYKWGGEQLSESARVRTAYYFFFLHLYRSEISPEWRNEGYCNTWQTQHLSRAEFYAAEVRQHLLRHGSEGRNLG